MPQTREELIEDFEKILDIQLANGNWDYDAYMHGMANGMIMFHSMAKNPTFDPDFKTAPDFWKAQIPRYRKKIKNAFKTAWLYFQWANSCVITNITGLAFEFENKTLIKYKEN